MAKRILTPAEMYLCDNAAIAETEGGSDTLMERAARGCFNYLTAHLITDIAAARVLVLCGGGNNGRDGYALAVMLAEDGISVDIRAFGSLDRMSSACVYRYTEARDHDLTIYTDETWEKNTYTCIVDAIFGIGLSKPVVGEAADAIANVNRYTQGRGIPLLAVDIPSGVDGLTGAVQGAAICATDTVCISHFKRGHLFYPGVRFCGKTTVLDIGIGDAVLDAHTDLLPVYALERDDLSRVPVRAPDGNKGTFGRVVIFAGSKNMCGAAYLSGLAAYRTGAGLVEIFTVEENRIPLQTLLPEAVLTTFAQFASEDAVCAALRRADAVIIGPGLGNSDASREQVRAVLTHTHCPTVVDADALNLIAKDPSLRDILRTCAARETVVLTPHPGEFSRLTGCAVSELKATFTDAAAAFAREFGVILAAKDARTVTTDGVCAYLNVSGSSAMAKGGSGDVLTGILGALLAQDKGMTSPLRLCALGVYIHGLAGECAANRGGPYGVLAREIADTVGKILR